ncbi:uncharacterized protein Z519_04168 [Cladophialophora bantiana CBS 173.52]|uniref:Transcription factor domain-containing protein n=1 Tax=Cladophialophora bantiana (strain ATCC 10958 / CBS 173.52 / CDC B-1940 / NIH 8579) TaxID=1442370 RepID=A0A0D2HQ76_CLAB1|nr:uncharacterized protein Z519_04168 [Cladophialophora bantiana CBS 173.52]KIW95583.1 hypothetical protein Z519_04168 [Cladophialophora bantiana CBS 173.52]
MGTSAAPPTTLISRLVINLDKKIRRTGSTANGNDGTWGGAPIKDSAEPIINRALMYAVYSYSVRWILINDKQYPDAEARSQFASMKNNLACGLYHQARKDMYAIMSLPSYRSVLALYLFAIIPSSIHAQGDSFSDLCLEASLSHQVYLQTRAQMPSSSGDSIASLLDRGAFSSTNITLMQEDSPLDTEKQEFQSMSRLAFWFGVISDTTRALTRCRPSIVLPGNTGESKVWSTVRQRTQLFEPQFKSLRAQPTPFTDDQVVAVLQHAFPLKTLVWAAITRVQDALVHQLSGISLAEAVDNARKESNLFEQTFGQLLCLCQRDFLLLTRTTQMYWTLLNIHFQVGNLILVDALPSTFVFIDQNTTPYDLRLCACRSIIIALNLALQTRYLGTDNVVRPNILLLDPYPDLMTNAIIRTGSSIFTLYNMQKLTTESALTMFAVVISALEVLAEISYTASAAIPLLKQRFEGSGIDRNAIFNNDVLHQAAASVSAAVDKDLFDADVLRQLEQQATDQSWIDRVVQQSEESPAPLQLPEEMEPIDLELFSRDWTFDV